MLRKCVFVALICSSVGTVSAECYVKSGLNYMVDQSTVGIVECDGADTESRRNVALAMARAKLSELTAANFEHAFMENGSYKTSDQFLTGFAGGAQIIGADTFGSGTRYQVRANLDQELRERMKEGMASFPGMAHRLYLLERRLAQMSLQTPGAMNRVSTDPLALSAANEMEQIRGTVLSTDAIQKRVVEYELIETGTLDYLQSLADSIQVHIESSELAFNARLGRWELKQEIRWELITDVAMPDWLKIAFVGNPGGRGFIAANGSRHAVGVFSGVVENYAIELRWGNGERAWSLTHPCTPYYGEHKAWGVNSCERSGRGNYMAVRLSELSAKPLATSDQMARVTVPLLTPHTAQEFGIIHAELVKTSN